MTGKLKKSNKLPKLTISEANLRKTIDMTNAQDWISEYDIDFLTIPTAEIFVRNLGITVIKKRRKHDA